MAHVSSGWCRTARSQSGKWSQVLAGTGFRLGPVADSLAYSQRRSPIPDKYTKQTFAPGPFRTAAVAEELLCKAIRADTWAEAHDAGWGRRTKRIRSRNRMERPQRGGLDSTTSFRVGFKSSLENSRRSGRESTKRRGKSTRNASVSCNNNNTVEPARSSELRRSGRPESQRARLWDVWFLTGRGLRPEMSSDRGRD